jgi:hypothetical protein
MKRTVGALALLGLVWAVSVSAAQAAGTPTVLWQPDLSTDKLVGPMVGGKEAPIFTQGVNNQTGIPADPTKTNPGDKPFVVITEANFANEDDNACSCDIAKGWLDGGDSDGVGDSGPDFASPNDDLDPDPTMRVYPSELLTGDPTWTDVSIQSKLDILNQNGGTAGFVLRAAPKTKQDDPDSFYVLTYTGGDEGVLHAQARDGIKPVMGQVKERDGATDYTVGMRILKVVKGKWTLLAEQSANNSPVYIPRIFRLGTDHDVSTDPTNDGQSGDALTGYYFRFTAKGNVLTAEVSKDAQKWDQVLQATDGDLTTGQVGFFHYGYHPLYKEILAQTAP